MLVAFIGIGGLLLMFGEASPIGNVLKAQAPAVHSPIVTCNKGQIMLNPRGVEAVKAWGRQKYGADWSPYSAAHINYNGIAYCADEDVVKDVVGSKPAAANDTEENASE